MQYTRTRKKPERHRKERHTDLHAYHENTDLSVKRSLKFVGKFRGSYGSTYWLNRYDYKIGLQVFKFGIFVMHKGKVIQFIGPTHEIACWVRNSLWFFRSKL